MDMTLYHQDFKETGIFGSMSWFKTLEHAYPGNPTGWVPIVQPGVYTCVLGAHRLDGMTEDFLTYEVMGVEGHTGILFHWGNWNKDSKGCILLGTAREGDMVMYSRKAFGQFMAMQGGAESFQLTVV